jgi:predicted  nucleic acid-binding Zn-ribbon protein
MTRCENCGHQFHNVLMRIDCPNCHRLLKEPNKPRQESDSGFDATGFAVGMATGVPLSPTHGVSVGSMIGAAMHSEPARSEEAPAPSAPEPSYSAPEPSYSAPDPSPSFDSGGGGSSGGTD